jgi:molybdopterin-guanine dinucleotide biosynthesis protein A
MTILGAMLAGGTSRRFGRDKADLLIAGHTLIEHCHAALSAQCDAVVICGRAWQDIPMLMDRPSGGAGPLAGLNAAMHHAAETGAAGVLSVPIDVYPLPDNLCDQLIGDCAAALIDQHLIGWWPSHLASVLDDFLSQGGRAMHEWIAQIDARRVVDPPGLVNINHVEDAQRFL